MIDELIRQLQDSNPAVRRRAILALGKSKNAAALKPLAAIVRGDPDPALRDLARKAGQYIRQQQPPKVSPFVEEPPLPDPDDDDLPTTGALLHSISSRDDDLPATRDLLTASPPQPLYDDPPPRAPAPRSSVPLRSLDDPAGSAGTALVRGRKYSITKQNEERAKHYLDAALSLSMSGDNAKAMKNLTEALSFNPNLINDQFFNNVAATVTGLEGDAATQMIIDRNQRKQFTDNAERKQKNRRVEQHMSEAQQSTWTDVWFEVILYALIVIIGPVLAVLVTTESDQTLSTNFAQVSSQLPNAFQNMQSVFAGLTLGALLPVGIVSGVSGLLSLLLQTVLIHYSAKMLGGVGTWRHLVQVLLSFYNKWFPILFFVLYITIAVAFISYFSPIILCFMIVLLVLSLYVSGKTSGKVGEAYDFGGAKGCLSLTISLLVIVVINVAISYALVQALGAAFSQVAVG